MDIFYKGDILKRIFRIVPIGCILPWLLLFVCSYPPVPENQDLVELERIWQYCKAFSLYSDRVPDHTSLLSFNNPQELVFSIYDTLYSHWEKKTWFYGYYIEPGTRMFGNPEEGVCPFPSLHVTNQYSTVNFYTLTDSTGYLFIGGFEDSTYIDFIEFNSQAKNMQNIIINLRNNRGGYVEPCLEIIDHFLPANISYLYVTERRYSSKDTGTIDTNWSSSMTDTIWGNKKVIILVDSLTASSSEILAVALRNELPPERISLIGQTTYGKAIGQRIFHMLNDATLSITMMRFLPKDSVNYHETGIIPDLNFSGPFTTNELLLAGKLLESGFENKVNSNTLNAIIAEFKAFHLNSTIQGCFRIVEKNELPF